MYIFTFTCKHFTYIFTTFFSCFVSSISVPLSASSVSPPQCPPSVLPQYFTSLPLLCPFSVPLSVPNKCPQCPLSVPLSIIPSVTIFFKSGTEADMLATKGRVGQHLIMLLDLVIDGWYGPQAFSIHCCVNKWLYRTNLHLAPNPYFVIRSTLTIFWLGDGRRDC